MKKKKLSAGVLVRMAMFTAMLCVASYISIPLPIPGSPRITLVNMIVLLIAMLFPVSYTGLIIAVWLLLGILGMPVFIGGVSGLGYLLSGWGGYTLAFLPGSLFIALFQKKRQNRILMTGVAVAGVCIIDFLGMLWLKGYSGAAMSWKLAWLTGFVAFLPLDLVKAVLAVQILPAFRRVMRE